MRVWRICRRPYIAFDGEGARRVGGRWNRPGTALVYTASSLSLATLELYVHLSPRQIPEDLVAVSARVPDAVSVKLLHEEQLPSDWREVGPPDSVQAIGSEWVQRGDSAVLCVPSAVVPVEYNYLLNPAHPDFPSIAVEPPVPFRFDPRMWK